MPGGVAFLTSSFDKAKACLKLGMMYKVDGEEVDEMNPAMLMQSPDYIDDQIMGLRVCTPAGGSFNK